MPSWKTTKESLRAGLREGMVFGLVYSAYVTVLFLAEGTKPFDALGVGYVSVVVLYLVGGVITGSLLGAVRPWARTLIKRLVVAPFVAFPAVLLISITLSSDRPHRILPLAVFGAVFFGVLFVLFAEAK